MSAEIITLPVIRIERNEGNGAREALIEIMSHRIACPLGAWDSPAVTDYILGKLYEAGFKVVPL